jgi:hypothetical protein
MKIYQSPSIIIVEGNFQLHLQTSGLSSLPLECAGTMCQFALGATCSSHAHQVNVVFLAPSECDSEPSCHIMINDSLVECTSIPLANQPCDQGCLLQLSCLGAVEDCEDIQSISVGCEGFQDTTCAVITVNI